MKNYLDYCLVLGVWCCFSSSIWAQATPAQDDKDQAEQINFYGVLDAKVRHFRFWIQLKRTGTGWGGVLASLDEGNAEFQLENVELNDEVFRFDLPVTQAEYRSQRSEAETTGTWSQRGNELQLNLKQLEQIPEEQNKAVWRGKLNMLVQKLELQIRQLESGQVYFDSLTQRAGGFLGSWKENGKQVTVEVPAIRGTFAGELSEDGDTIEGTWKQGLVPIPLNLERQEIGAATVVTAPSRPQMPREPFPYSTREVHFTNAQADIQLAGTLTIPNSEALAPAVILISGSGPQDRDETIAEHKPFWVIADYLTRRGIAVLRFDDRGVGASSGDFASATTEDFASDVEAAFDYLSEVPEIDGQRIGLCGHSEGGLVAPLVAGRRSDVRFVILLAGPGVIGERIIVSQTRLILEADKSQQLDIEQQLAMQRIVLDLAKEDPSLTSEEFRKRAKQQLETLLGPEEAEQVANVEFVRAAEQQLNSPWFRYFLVHDPAPQLQRLTCSVLALIGEKDLQVDPELNLPAIRQALEASEAKSVTLKELPGLNHLFQECVTGLPSEYGEIEQTISPVVLSLLAEWVQSQR